MQWCTHTGRQEACHSSCFGVPFPPRSAETENSNVPSMNTVVTGYSRIVGYRDDERGEQREADGDDRKSET